MNAERTTTSIRACAEGDFETVYTVINAAAEAYRGVIPADRPLDPYMPRLELQEEIDHGVAFWAAMRDGVLSGVMGLQAVDEVTLIRHAYVLPEYQGLGIGTLLLEFLRARTDRPLLIGTWAASTRAIAFYEKHGFSVAHHDDAIRLLRRYWHVPQAQMSASVVLANVPFEQLGD